MTETTPTPPTPTVAQKALAAWRSLTLAQTLLVTVLTAGTIYVFQTFPADRLEALMYFVAALLTGGTITGAAAALSRRRPAAETRSNRRGGFANDGVLWAVAAVAGVVTWLVEWAHRAGFLAVLLVLAASGCRRVVDQPARTWAHPIALADGTFAVPVCAEVAGRTTDRRGQPIARIPTDTTARTISSADLRDPEPEPLPAEPVKR